jgi:hypothetical protein
MTSARLRRLSLLRRKKLLELIDAAVDEALTAHGCALTTITRVSIRSTARNAFLRRVEESARIIRGMSKTKFLRELKHFQDVAHHRETMRSESIRDLPERIRALLPAGLQPEDSAALESGVVDLVAQSRQYERESALAETAHLIDRYERRLLKLSRGLERAEQGLEQLARAHPEDAGVASLYREVQGLDEDDELLELKRALLENIFKANLVFAGG